jgi:hypothetical protein
MKKINDRIFLGIISGFVGWVAFALTDVFLSKKKISKRPYPTIAAGILVSSRREAEKWTGQFLGTLLDIGICMVGGVSVVKMLTTFGRDKLVPKGLFFGVTFGGVLTALLNKLSNKKVIPNDALSNILYIVSHAVFGLVSTFTASKLGDDSLFDIPPKNDYSKPTEKTTEQRKGSENSNVQLAYSDVNPNQEDP